MQIIQQARLQKFEARRSFNPLNLSDPKVLALRPLAIEFLTAHGLTTTSPKISQVQAVVDSVARHTVHPYQPFHQNGNATSNLDVLATVAQTWAQMLTIAGTNSRADNDNAYWGGFYRDGYTMLNLLFGTVNDADGTRANDGMLNKISAGRYRIKDTTTFRFMQCSQQNSVLGALLGALGFQTMLVTTTGHDPMCVWIPELGKWAWACSTYNEMLQLDNNGIPLSPLELFTLSAGGAAQRARVNPMKIAGPSWDSAVYIDPAQPNSTYFFDGHPLGQRVLAGYMDSRALLPGFTGADRNVVLDTPGLLDAGMAPLRFPSFIRTTIDVLYPDLGAGFQRADQAPTGEMAVRLVNNWPAFSKYRKRVNGGAWADFLSAAEVLPAGTGLVEYSPVDTQGYAGMSAILRV